MKTALRRRNFWIFLRRKKLWSWFKNLGIGCNNKNRHPWCAAPRISGVWVRNFSTWDPRPFRPRMTRRIKILKIQNASNPNPPFPLPRLHHHHNPPRPRHAAGLVSLPKPRQNKIFDRGRHHAATSFATNNYRILFADFTFTFKRDRKILALANRSVSKLQLHWPRHRLGDLFFTFRRQTNPK